MTRLLILLALTSCGIDVHSRPQLRWIGDVTPEPNQPACQKTEGILLLREGEVTFAPDQGTWVLTGTATPAGAIDAEASRPTTSKTTFATKLIARWTESSVTGTYTTPRCAFRVSLQRR